MLTLRASMALRKPSHTTSTFVRLVGSGWLWAGLPSGRGYMLQAVSSSLPITSCFQRSHSVPFVPVHPVLLTPADLSSVRKRLMWLVESSCVMKVWMLSRKTCRREETTGFARAVANVQDFMAQVQLGERSSDGRCCKTRSLTGSRSSVLVHSSGTGRRTRLE